MLPALCLLCGCPEGLLFYISQLPDHSLKLMNLATTLSPNFQGSPAQFSWKPVYSLCPVRDEPAFLSKLNPCFSSLTHHIPATLNLRAFPHAISHPRTLFPLFLQD